MRNVFLFASLTFACYASHVQAAEITVPKALFKMGGPASTVVVIPLSPTPQGRKTAVSPAQPQFEYRQVQVCYGNYCRMEWRLMPVNQPSVAPVQTYQSNR